MKEYSIIFYFVILLFTSISCNSQDNQKIISKDTKPTNNPELKKDNSKEKNLKITFIELGSVNCIPCRMMQPIMKSVEEKYGEQIKVIFYDVWKPEQRYSAQKYGIRVIPTQVFLNADENEIFRHEGYFPEEELDQFLQNQGLVVQTDIQEK